MEKNPIINKVLEELDARYAEKRDKEAENLYNAIADVCVEQKPTRQTVVFVAELMKYVALRSKYEEISGNVKVPVDIASLGKVKLGAKIPTSIQ